MSMATDQELRAKLAEARAEAKRLQEVVEADEEKWRRFNAKWKERDEAYCKLQDMYAEDGAQIGRLTVEKNRLGLVVDVLLARIDQLEDELSERG